MPQPGGYIGFRRVPSASSAQGVWSLRDAELYVRANEWPRVVSSTLLLHFDGANNADTTTDSSGNNRTVTLFGSAKISTAQSKFGGSSGYFDASASCYASVATGSHFDFGSGDFAVEFWYRPTDPVDNAAILSFGWTSSNKSPLLIYSGSGPVVTVYSSSDSSTWNVASGETLIANPTNGTWYHIAVSRYGGNLRLYADGVLATTVPVSGSLMNCESVLAICGRSDGTYTTGAYIDELRITKGNARGYTGSSYTLDTEAFPNE